MCYNEGMYNKSDKMSNRDEADVKSRRHMRVWLIAGLVVLVIGGGLFGFYKWRQSLIVLDPPSAHSVESESSSLVLSARTWFESLTAQHQQPFLKQKDRVKDYEIDKIKVLEKGERNIVQIDFDLELTVPDSDAFGDWSLVYDEDRISAQWVVTFDISGPSQDGKWVYTATRIQRPAAYDLEIYNSSGQKELDELNHEMNDEKPYDPAQYPYKIENGVCSVSYDGGSTWVETPLPIDQLDYYVDGHFKTNELREGSYVISPEKTALLYGGFNTTLTCLYSDDKGATWHTTPLDDAPLYCHIKFLSFPTSRDGYIIVGSDKTMSWEAESLYKTADGGETWTFAGAGPETRLMQSAGFIAPDVGFISYRYIEGATALLYRTEDAGATWSPVELDIKPELQPYFTAPQTPVWQDGRLLLMVREGSDSDYPEEEPMQLEYESKDMGVTWTYVDMVALPTPKEPG
jgi:hypothetical protein